MVRTRIVYEKDSLFSHTGSNNFHLMYGDKEISWYLFNITHSGLELIPGLSTSWFSINNHSTLIIDGECDVI